MCLIALAWHVHQKYALILAGNRDEFFERPSAPIHWWNEAPHVLAGRDLQGGGTWMGVTHHGKFCALTNIRNPKKLIADAPSRGELVANVLLSDQSTGLMMADIAINASAYNGFNLLAGQNITDQQLGQLWIVSNNADAQPRQLEAGIYGLSNAQLDTPWPKLLAARESISNVMNETEPEKIYSLLLTAFADTQIAADKDLPHTGIPLDRERGLSSAFIRLGSPIYYGTGATTILLVGWDGQAIMTERTFDREGNISNRTETFMVTRQP